jgi:hypothetical protein
MVLVLRVDAMAALALAALSALGTIRSEATVLPPSLALRETPADILASCRRSPLLRAACPRSVPAGYRYGATLCRAGTRGCLGLRNDLFDIDSVPNSIRPEPGFVHIVVYGGDLGGPRGFQRHGRSAFPFDWPDVASARPHEAGLTRHRRTKAIALGRHRFGAITGELILAPTIQALDGGHVIFRWGKPRRELAVSLHAWEPLPEAVSTLRAIVRSTPAARS